MRSGRKSRSDGLRFFRCLGCCRNWSRDGQIGTPLIYEADYMRQRGVVAQLAILVARNVVNLADGGEHFRLLHRVNSEVCFEVEIQVEHIFWIAGLLHDQRQDALFHGISRAVCRRSCQRSGRRRRKNGRRRRSHGLSLLRCLRCCRNRCRNGQVGTLLIHEPDDVR